MVDAIANAVGPWGTILAVILSAIGLLVYVRKFLFKILGNTQTVHPDGSTESVSDKTQAVAEKADIGLTHSVEQNAAIIELAEQLGLSKQSQDWMAKRNDDMLAALLNLVTLFRDEKIAERVRHTEEGMAAIETEMHELTRTLQLFTQQTPTQETR